MKPRDLRLQLGLCIPWGCASKGFQHFPDRRMIGSSWWPHPLDSQHSLRQTIAMVEISTEQYKLQLRPLWPLTPFIECIIPFISSYDKYITNIYMAIGSKDVRNHDTQQRFRRERCRNEGLSSVCPLCHPSAAM